MSLTPFAPFRPDVIEDECGDDESKKDSNNAIADVIEIDIGVIDFVGPSSMAEILRLRLFELREFTKMWTRPLAAYAFSVVVDYT